MSGPLSVPLAFQELLVQPGTAHRAFDHGHMPDALPELHLGLGQALGPDLGAAGVQQAVLAAPEQQGRGLDLRRSGSMGGLAWSSAKIRASCPRRA